MLAGFETAGYTYAEVGATRGTMPSGYAHTHFRRAIGNGPEDFDLAVDALLQWKMQRGAGMGVAVDGPAAEGRTVVMALGHPIGLVVPCRVVYAVDEPQRKGFAYGTLPGHPESGEEAFIITIDDDSVGLEITAFSRPGSRLVAAAGPLNRLIQHTALRGYARSLRRQL